MASLSLRARRLEHGDTLDVERRLGGYVRQRACRKLGKHGQHIERIIVRFEDANGRSHPDGTLCRLTIHLVGLASVIVEERAPDPRCAFDEALAAAEVAVVRSLDRSVARSRQRPRAELTRGAARHRPS